MGCIFTKQTDSEHKDGQTDVTIHIVIGNTTTSFRKEMPPDTASTYSDSPYIELPCKTINELYIGLLVKTSDQNTIPTWPRFTKGIRKQSENRESK